MKNPKREIARNIQKLRRDSWKGKLKAYGINVEEVLELEKNQLDKTKNYSKELQQTIIKKVERNAQEQVNIEKYLSKSSFLSICPDPAPPISLPPKDELIEGWVSKWTSPIEKKPRVTGYIREWEPFTELDECLNGRVEHNKVPEDADTIICEGSYQNDGSCIANGKVWVMSLMDGNTYQADTHMKHDFQFHSLKSTEYRFTPEFYINGSLVKSILEENSENWAQVNFYIYVDDDMKRQQNVYNRYGDILSYSEVISITSLDPNPALNFFTQVDEGQTITITIDCELFARAKDMNQVLIDLSLAHHYFKAPKLHIEELKKKIPIYESGTTGDFAPPQEIIDIVQPPIDIPKVPRRGPPNGDLI